MVDTPSYRQASFRGVEFSVVSHEIEMGRRGPLHEYVNEDDPYFEDMGKQPRRVTVSAYVRGADHLDRARALERAVETRGSGLLVLPSRQTMQSVCVSCRRSDSLETDKRQSSFEMEFVPAGEFRFPSSIFDAILGIADTVSGLIFDVVTTVQAPIESVLEVTEVYRSVFSQVGMLLPSSATTPETLTASLSDLAQLESVSLAIDAALQLASVETASAPVISNPTLDERYQRQLRFDGEMRAAAALQAVSLATSLEFTNRVEVTRLRDGIDDALVRDIELIESSLVPRVLEARRLFLVDMQRRVLTLPTFRTVELGDSFPSVVAAHMILGNYTREEDLRIWNQVEHPLFMPSTVEVLG